MVRLPKSIGALVSQMAFVFKIGRPESRPSSSRHQENHRERRNQLEDQSHGPKSEACKQRIQFRSLDTRHLRSILELASPDGVLSLLLGEIQQVEVSPMMEWPTTISSQNQEHRGPCNRNEVER